MEELVRRVDELVPNLRERALKTEALRCLPDETMAELEDAEIFQAVTPRALGGHGFGPRAIVEISKALARGCMSTAWTVQFLMQGSAMTARFPTEVQEEAFGKAPYALTAGGLASVGIAVPTDGGYHLSGRWGFVSGVMHADWLRVGALIDGKNGPEAMQVFMIPKKQVTIHDTWHSAGLRGTGSHDVSVDHVFVPAYRALSMELLRSSHNPGALRHGGYARLPLEQLTPLMLPAQAVGGARGALEVFRDQAATRKMPLSNYSPQIQSPLVQARYARAAGNLRIADLVLDDMVTLLERVFLNSDDEVTAEQETMLTLDSANVAHMAGEVVSSLCRASGGGSYRLENALQRFERDVNTLLSHPANDRDRIDEVCGKMLLGVPISATPAGSQPLV